MALTKNQFSVLADLLQEPGSSQREIAAATGLSLGTVNGALKELRRLGLVSDEGNPTEAGENALAPYKVDNAIIMAAGISSRFAPLSYERPKGVLRVKDEVLIERQIRQLQEAGIDDITVVVGYMKEQFFYLEDRFGVSIRVNEEYERRNNNSTLMLIREKLGNTFICSSDNYFAENVFEPYVYQAYYAATFFEGPTEEYLLQTGPGNCITAVTVGGSDAYGMLGHAYFDRDFSQRFRSILEEEYEWPETEDKLWEDIYRDHIGELPMVMRPYDDGVIYEFDSLNELRDFDPDFIENVDSSILDNICKVFSVERSAVHDIVPINQGVTNLSCRFTVNGEDYVYRHPGVGTDGIIDRAAETFSEEIAADLGLDDTFIYEDSEQGWKISRYLHDFTEFDYGNARELQDAMAMIRTLHGCGAVSPHSFDVFEKTQEIIARLSDTHRANFPDFLELLRQMESLAAFGREDSSSPVLCHNNLCSPNILVADGKLHFIDWEYSAMADYGCDLGTFIACSDYSLDESLDALEIYFGRPLSPEELRHCIVFVALSAYYWFIWALYKDESAAPVGEWLYRWYRTAKLYGAKGAELLEEGGVL